RFGDPGTLSLHLAHSRWNIPPGRRRHSKRLLIRSAIVSSESRKMFENDRPRMAALWILLVFVARVLAQVSQTSPSNIPSPSSSGTDNSRILPNTGAGAIRYQQPVGGKGEADLGFRSVRKPEGWSQSLQTLLLL